MFVRVLDIPDASLLGVSEKDRCEGSFDFQVKFLLRTLLVLAREEITSDIGDESNIEARKSEDFSVSVAKQLWIEVFPLDEHGRRKQITIDQVSLQNLFLQLWKLVSIPSPGSSAGTGEGRCASSSRVGSDEARLLCIKIRLRYIHKRRAVHDFILAKIPPTKFQSVPSSTSELDHDLHPILTE
jgi:hypothetical protein